MPDPTPPQPDFVYLKSKVHNSNMVLTARPTSNDVHLTRQAVDTATEQLQMWRAMPAGADTIVLLNLKRDMVLKRTGLQGPKVVLAPRSEAANQDAKWRIEQKDAEWQLLNAINDWEQKLNVRGNGPYDENTDIITYEWSHNADNERWKLNSEGSSFTLRDIHYDLDHAVIDASQPPDEVDTTIITNTSGVTATVSGKLTRTHTTERTFSFNDSSTESMSIIRHFNVSFPVGEFAAIEAGVSVETTSSRTIAIGRQTSDSFAESKEVEFSVPVDPGKSVECAIRVYSGRLRVPFTATVHRVTATGESDYPLVGQFTTVQATRFEIVARTPGSTTKTNDSVIQTGRIPKPH